MRINFEATIDEVLDVQERAVRRSGSFNSRMRRAAVINTLVSGISSGVSAYLVSYWFGSSFNTSMVAAIIGALVGSSVAWTYPHDKTREQLRTHLRESYGDRNTFPFDIVLSEKGISIKQLGAEHNFEWSNIEEVRETEDNIEFYIYGGAVTFIKKTAFRSSDEKEEFIKYAHDLINTSRTSSNWLHEG